MPGNNFHPPFLCNHSTDTKIDRLDYKCHKIIYCGVIDYLLIEVYVRKDRVSFAVFLDLLWTFDCKKGINDFHLFFGSL